MFDRFAGILLMGIVIKLMDDFLDKDIDRESEQWNISYLLGRSIIPYSLLFIIISLYLNFSEAAAIFSASYFIGMLHSHREKLPTGLYGWQEGLVVLILFIYILSLEVIFSAIMIIGIIQLLDDIIDYKKEKYINYNNLVNQLGLFNTVVITIMLILLSLNFFPTRFFHFILAALGVYIIFHFIKKYFRTDFYGN